MPITVVKFIQNLPTFFLCKPTLYAGEIVDIANVEFKVIDQQLIITFYSSDTGEKRV